MNPHDPSDTFTPNEVSVETRHHETDPSTDMNFLVANAQQELFGWRRANNVEPESSLAIEWESSAGMTRVESLGAHSVVVTMGELSILLDRDGFSKLQNGEQVPFGHDDESLLLARDVTGLLVQLSLGQISPES